MTKEELKKYNHSYYLANQERLLSVHKDNYFKNRKRYQKWHKEYQQTEKRKEYLKKYREKKLK